MIGSVSGATASPGAGTSLGGLDSDAFLKLLVAQLRYQNPMEPSDATAMLQQTAMFTQVETMQRVSEAQRHMLGLQQAGVAAELVGREVSAVADDGRTLTGTVEGVRFAPTGPVLLLGADEVALGGVVQVRRPDSSV